MVYKTYKPFLFIIKQKTLQVSEIFKPVIIAGCQSNILHTYHNNKL